MCVCVTWFARGAAAVGAGAPADVGAAARTYPWTETAVPYRGLTRSFVSAECAFLYFLAWMWKPSPLTNSGCVVQRVAWPKDTEPHHLRSAEQRCSEESSRPHRLLQISRRTAAGPVRQLC